MMPRFSQVATGLRWDFVLRLPDGDLLESLQQIITSEVPAKRFRGLVVPLLEPQDTLFDSLFVRQIQRRERLAGQDREVDLDLIQPTGMRGQVNHGDVGIGSLQKRLVQHAVSVYAS